MNVQCYYVVKVKWKVYIYIYIYIWYSISETVNLSVCAASALSLQLITGKVLVDKLYEQKKNPYISLGPIRELGWERN